MFDNIQVMAVILEDHCLLFPTLTLLVAVFLLLLWIRADP